MSITIRRQGGEIDEIVADRARVHWEMMDDDAAHLIITSGTARVDVSVFAAAMAGGRLSLMVQNKEGNVHETDA